MSRIRFVRRAALASAIIGAALACHGTDVMSPRARSVPASPSASSNSQAGNQSSNGGQQDNDHPPKPVACQPHRVVVGNGVFGPRGGVLAVGDSRLFIPGGALRDTVTITGTALGDGTSTISFQPEGLHFEKPVQLSLSGAGCALPTDGSPSIVYLGPDGTVQETIPAQYESRYKAVTAPIVHFSGYAIAF